MHQTVVSGLAWVGDYSPNILVGVLRVGGGLSCGCQYTKTLVHLLVSSACHLLVPGALVFRLLTLGTCYLLELGTYHLLLPGAMLRHPASMVIQHLLHASVARHEHHDHLGEGCTLQDGRYDQRFPC